MYEISSTIMQKRTPRPAADRPPLERTHAAKVLWLLWHGEAVTSAELAAMGVGPANRLAGLWDAQAVQYADACEAGDAYGRSWLPKPQPLNVDLNTRLRKRLPLGDGRFM